VSFVAAIKDTLFREAEISNFKISVSIKDNIFRLQISI
jgi:hypothetical protein